MAGDERTQFPKGQEPTVRRRPGDPRDVPVAPPGPRIARPTRSRGEPEGTGRLRGGEPAGPSGPPGPIESYSSGAPRDRLVEDGRFGELFVLFIINFLLGIVTLGIYRFWGKTRIRKYVWSHASFRGERFEYSGNGLELFLGFLFALVTFGPPFIGFYAWIYFDRPGPKDSERFVQIALVGYLLAFIAIYFLHVAVYAAHRYRVSRTIWRGVRGSVSGSAWTYGFLGFGLGILNGLALGWTKPWADTVLIKYRLGRTSVGSAMVSCNINPGPLYGSFALAWVLTAVATVVAVVGVIVVFAGASALGRRPTAADMAPLILIAVILFLLIPLVWLITINFYRAKLLRHTAASSTLSGLSFRFGVGGWSLLWFLLSNFLLTLISFGLLLPLVILRYARFVARHLRIEGDLDYAQVRQSEDRGPRYGEGIAEFFGLGVI